jgi:iron complex outermembrane receptor protein
MALALATPCAMAEVAGEGESAAVQALETVKVTAVRAEGLRPQTVEAGSFRGASVMDVPSTVNVITREALDLQGAAGLYDAVRNTAGVARQQNGGETWDQLVIRGIAVENRTNYRLNGSMPILNFSQVPLEDKERVEVLKGASALYYGFSSPAGVVNYVTKRAGAQPVTTLGLTLDDQGTTLGSLDIGRRFGEQEQVGLRVNAAGGALGSYLDGVNNGHRSFGSAAWDWRVNSRLKLSGDLEYDKRRLTEQVGVTLPTAVNGVITLPHAVDPRQLVGPDWAAFRTETTNAQIRADLALNDDWALTLEAGRSVVKRNRSLPTFRFSNVAGVLSGDGRIVGNIQQLTADSDLLRAELAGSVEAAGLRHELTLGLSQTRKSQDPIYQQTYTIAAQNLYNPVAITSVTYGAIPSTPTTAGLETRDQGAYVLDRIELSPRWQLFAGLRHSDYKSDQGTAHYTAKKNTPMAAAVYKLSEALSFYASYAKGLEEGDTAPTGSSNVGERMAPGVSTQQEVGTRWLTEGGTLLSAALFNIKRPGAYTNASSVYVADGQQRYRGLELSTQGTLTRELSWQTSALWLDPKFRHISAAYEGKLPENAARQTGSVFLSYALAQVPGLSLSSGAYYTGRRPVNDLDQAWLGGVTTYTLGGRYTTRLMGLPSSWQLNVENVADKQYWAAGGTRLAAGAPRSVKLSLKLDL